MLLTSVINTQGVCVKFRRTLVGIDQQEWASILHTISSISFTHSHDKVSWRWEPTGAFSVRSLYKILNFRGEQVAHPMLWWSIPIPHKIQIFMWLTCKYKILTKDHLKTKGWQGSIKCEFCNQEESVNHMFITCSFARQVWFWMGQCHQHFFKWSSMEDIITFAVSLPKYDKTAFLMVLSALCWTIWKHRNELCFQNVQPKTGRNIIFLIISLLQYWLGSKKIKQQVREGAQVWMPTEEMLEQIPIRVWLPGDDQIEPYQHDDPPEEHERT